MKFRPAGWYVYVIRECGSRGAIKIGVSGNPALRCKNMQIHSPYELILHFVEGPYESSSDAHFREADYHDALTKMNHHIRGEWFAAGALAWLDGKPL